MPPVTACHGHSLSVLFLDAENPAFEMRKPDGSARLAVWADGRTEGFPAGYSLLVNRIPGLIHAAVWSALHQQLPDGMESCKIRFIECEKGHGRLTATNWLGHGCPTCDLDTLREKVTHLTRDNARQAHVTAMGEQKAADAGLDMSATADSLGPHLAALRGLP
jgi:hypothetical protein